MPSSSGHVRKSSWESIPRETLGPKIGRKLFTGSRIMIAQVFLDRGAIVPMHRHENEQMTYILKGKLRFWIGEDESEVVDVGAGEMLSIPGRVWHKAEALEDTLDVDVFTPPRKDWLDGTDDYLRGE